jgi:hypothetical protein
VSVFIYNVSYNICYYIYIYFLFNYFSFVMAKFLQLCAGRLLGDAWRWKFQVPEATDRLWSPNKSDMDSVKSNLPCIQFIAIRSNQCILIYSSKGK